LTAVRSPCPVALVRKLPAYGVPVAPAQTLIVVGATGDLCGRLLLPALARLYVADELPAGFRFVGAGPQGWDLLTFQDHVRTRLAKFAPDLATDRTDTFVGELSYHHVDVLNPAAFSDLFEDAANGASLTVYLALPTHLIAAAVRAMGLIGRPASLRVAVAVEKPFGSDLKSAEDLNAALARTASDEGHIFRVDHILGMPTVQALPSTLMRLRPQSGVSPSPDVTKVSILWEETLALEGRAAFYDRTGALKDLLQNHLLQILCQVTMSSSGESTGGDWSRRRLKALREVQIPTADQARTTTRRARYTAGTLARTGEAAPVEVPDGNLRGSKPARPIFRMVEHPIRSACRQSHGSPPPGHPHTIPAALSYARRRRPVDRSRRTYGGRRGDQRPPGHQLGPPGTNRLRQRSTGFAFRVEHALCIPRGSRLGLANLHPNSGPVDRRNRSAGNILSRNHTPHRRLTTTGGAGVRGAFDADSGGRTPDHDARRADVVNGIHAP